MYTHTGLYSDEDDTDIPLDVTAVAIISFGVLFIALTINPSMGNESNPNAYGVKKVVLFTMEGSLHVNVLEKLLCILPKHDAQGILIDEEKEIKKSEDGLQDEIESEKRVNGKNKNENENANDNKNESKNEKKNENEIAGEDKNGMRRNEKADGLGHHIEKEVEGREQVEDSASKSSRESSSKNVPGQNTPEFPLKILTLEIDPLKNSKRLNEKDSEERNGDNSDSNSSNNNDSNNSNTDNNDNNDSNDDYSNDNGSSSDDYDQRDGTAIHLVEARTLVSQNYKKQNNGNSSKKSSKNNTKQNMNIKMKNDESNMNGNSRRGSKVEIQRRNGNNENSIKLIGFESKSHLNKNHEEHSQYIKNLKNLPESSSRRIRSFDFDEICSVSSTPDSLVLQRSSDAVIFSGNLQNSITVQDLDSKLYVSGDTLFEWSRGPAISGCMYKQSVRMCVNNNSSTYGTEGEKEHKSYFRLRDNKLQYSKDEFFLSGESMKVTNLAEVKVIGMELEREVNDEKVQLEKDILTNVKTGNRNENENEIAKKIIENEKIKSEEENKFLQIEEKFDSQEKKTESDSSDKIASESDAASVSTSTSASTSASASVTASTTATTSATTSSYIPSSFTDILFPKQNTTIAASASSVGSLSANAPTSIFRTLGAYAR